MLEFLPATDLSTALQDPLVEPGLTKKRDPTNVAHIEYA